ncbi:MAG: acyl-CoA dehydrogenase family protein [Sinobacteraceae bacterium]|nr:acyl-CoA dehydrogenase family protein [Nevskiaceae bacterium]MCP5359796.1 acyl-CoA dehydrogenase family protein [Nevskiaceae bacterium]MCP5467407.1 acyl-CoA dehydrogenase family protein [Nevskiaceae bacterium]MCP5472714.1 acyl-CoA dehydrogenase family protein [Nevskiaceae bacterium]
MLTEAADCPAYLRDADLGIFEHAAARFLDDHATPAATRAWRDAGQVDPSLWRLAGEAGLLGLQVPVEYGGAGADFRFEAILMEQLAAHDALNFAVPLHNAVVAPYLIDYATAEQKARWLPGVVAGECILAVGMSEPAAGSDLQSMRTTARRDGDGYVLNGQKIFISNGQVASLFVVAAKTDADAGARGISLFVVDSSAPGFARGRLLEKLGQEGRDTTEIFLSNVRVPASHLLGGVEGRGFAMLMEKLPQERLVIAWQALGMMRSALRHTVAYVKERRAFGKALIEFQNTQFKLAECKTTIRVAEAFLHRCTEQLLSGTLDGATASMAKYWITEAQSRVIDECLQLFGGYGYMLEYPIAEMYKDARAFRIYGGSSEIMKLMIARTL